MSTSVPIQFTNRNGAGSKSLETLIEKKFEGLYKFAPNITKIHVILNTDNKTHNKTHIAEAEIHIPKMKPVFAEAKTEDMYKSIDFLVEKLTKQLAKHKEKITDH